MAVSAAVLLVPVALLLLSGRRRKGGGPVNRPGPAGMTPYGADWTSRDVVDGLNEQSEGGFPLSDRMLLTEDCTGPAAKAIKWRYDGRITNYYWYMRREWGLDDPVVLTAEILYLDSPQCEWPPPEYASEWQHIIWEGTYAAVKTYFDLEQSGELGEYAWDPHDPTTVGYVKPLVVWA